MFDENEVVEDSTTPEEDEHYEALLASGMSDYEAREEVWPSNPVYPEPEIMSEEEVQEWAESEEWPTADPNCLCRCHTGIGAGSVVHLAACC